MAPPRILALALLALSPPLGAQDLARSALHPITAPVKYAGVYHLGTGTWTRPGPSGAGAPAAGSNAAILYDNTCTTGYWAAMQAGTRIFDEGRLPSPTSPVLPNGWSLGHDSEAGTQASYQIDGFQIAYCTFNAAPISYAIEFFEAYEPCSPATGVPTASFALTGLPGVSPGGFTCWLVDIDLCAASQSFAMVADADQVYDGHASGRVDTFGWSIELLGPSPLAGDGYIVSGGSLSGGSFLTCSGSDGTVFDSGASSAVYPTNSDAIALGCATLAAGASPEPGSGMGTQDRFRFENSPYVPDGCYWFGPNLLGSFHLQLYSADVALPNSAPASSFCEPALGGMPACPCSNPPSGASRGCDNSAATGGASLGASGSASLAADTLLFATAGEPAVPTILVQGTSGSAPLQRGQGLRCVGGPLKILYVRAAAGGGITVPGPGDASVSARSAALGDPIASGTPRYYFAMYRDPVVLGSCTATATFNCSDANAVLWN